MAPGSVNLVCSNLTALPGKECNWSLQTRTETQAFSTVTSVCCLGILTLQWWTWIHQEGKGKPVWCWQSESVLTFFSAKMLQSLKVVPPSKSNGTLHTWGCISAITYCVDWRKKNEVVFCCQPHPQTACQHVQFCFFLTHKPWYLSAQYNFQYST